MCQSRLSHCMLLNTYKEALDELREGDARLNMFGTFTERDTPHDFAAEVSVATKT